MDKSIIKEIESREYLIQEIFDNLSKKPLIIFTSSVGADCAVLFLKEKSIKISAVCDNDKEKQGQYLQGIKIISPQEAIEVFGVDANFFIASISYEQEIFNQLRRELKVPAINCYFYSIIQNWNFKYINSIGKLHINFYEKKFQQVAEFLDEQSKEIYLSMLTHIYYGFTGPVNPKYISANQYFQKDIFNISDNEVFVDVGVFDGNTIKEFIEFTNSKYKYIYGFEADPYNYERSAHNLKGIDNIVLYNNALFDKNTIVKFVTSDTPSLPNVASSRIGMSGNIEVKTVVGDELDIEPTFIKMDIEGAEMSALRGFKNTIIKYKPKLAICIYHSFDDFWKIPLYIKELVPEYKIFIRNHSDFYFYGITPETVCYAVI